MDKLLHEAGQGLLQKHSESIGKIKVIMNSGEDMWSDIILVEDRLVGATKRIGVYRFLYKPLYEETNDIETSTKYIGAASNVGSRRSSHKRVFENKGKAIHAPGGTVFHSPAGQRMYEFDTNLNNWLYSWIEIDDIDFAKAYEAKLINDENPEFNNDNQAGI
jgi:hypothetical protein